MFHINTFEQISEAPIFENVLRIYNHKIVCKIDVAIF